MQWAEEWPNAERSTLLQLKISIFTESSRMTLELALKFVELN